MGLIKIEISYWDQWNDGLENSTYLVKLLETMYDLLLMQQVTRQHENQFRKDMRRIGTTFVPIRRQRDSSLSMNRNYICPDSQTSQFVAVDVMTQIF